MAQLGNFTFRCPPSQLVRGERSGLLRSFSVALELADDVRPRTGVIELVTGDNPIFGALVKVLDCLFCRFAAKRKQVRYLKTVMCLKYLKRRLAG